MKLKQGLVGFFVLIFFLGMVGLISISMEDKKDLSGRASGPVISNLNLPPENLSESTGKTVWDGEELTPSIPFSLAYDNNIWQASTTDSIFYYRQKPITVRFVPTKLVSDDYVKSVIGNDFTQAKKINFVPQGVTSWQVTTYEYQFFGDSRIVSVWKGSEGVSMIVVSKDTASMSVVSALVDGMYPNTDQVKGTSVTDETARIAALVRPSVVMIVSDFCATMKYKNIPGSSLSEKSYPFCVAGSGTGFFVNPDGYIATNGHVVSFDTPTVIISGVMTGQLDNFLIDFTVAYAKESSGIELDRNVVSQKVLESRQSKESLYQLASIASTLVDKKFVTIDNPKYKYYVQLGKTPITFSPKTGVNLGPDIVSATFIASDYAESSATSGFSSSDVALLKINGENYPALPLGKTEDILIGSSIQVIGYPGVAGGQNSALLDVSANSEPTITRGIVSAIKQAKGNKKNLIQTDASINHGNSGGPAVDASGKVIGIATYGLTPEDGGGNYNFLRDIEDLRALMDRNHVSTQTGKTFDTWKSGLDAYWLSYYRYAKNDFAFVASSYVNHPTVEHYLNDVSPRVGTQEDATPKFSKSQRNLLKLFFLGLMLFSVLAIVILYVSLRSDHKQNPLLNAEENKSSTPNLV